MISIGDSDSVNKTEWLPAGYALLAENIHELLTCYCLFLIQV